MSKERIDKESLISNDSIESSEEEFLKEWELLKDALKEIDKNPTPQAEIEEALRKHGSLSLKALFMRFDI